MTLPAGSTSRMRQITLNPSGATPSAMETELRGPGWWITDMGPLVYGMPEERGDSTLVPHRQGRMPNPSYIDETVYVMPFFVTGACSGSGTPPTGSPPYAQLQQLRDNAEWLRENVMGPYDGTTTTRVAKITFADGAEVLVNVKCRLAFVKQRGATADYVLDVRVPDGIF